MIRCVGFISSVGDVSAFSAGLEATIGPLSPAIASLVDIACVCVQYVKESVLSHWISGWWFPRVVCVFLVIAVAA